MFDYTEEWRDRALRNSGNLPPNFVADGKVPIPGRKRDYNKTQESWKNQFCSIRNYSF